LEITVSIRTFAALVSATIAVAAFTSSIRAETPAACLPGELSADEVLDGKYPFPPSPKVDVRYDDSGLDHARLGKVPPPGVHPRLLISPDQLPDLRRRVKETEAGRAILATLRERTGGSILKDGTWENQVYGLLAAGSPKDVTAALAILSEKRKASFPEGHYQPNLPYAITMEALEALITDDSERGKKVASAIVGWASAIGTALDQLETAPLNDDVWRAKLAGPVTGSISESKGVRDLMGNHLLGYAYDFAYNFMTPEQQASVRKTISRATRGKVWMGARLPHHFRNWNWCAVGLSQPLLALSIEGEEGYDPRVFKMGVDIAQDYLTYGISPSGSSTEAVGYTQFGFVWAAPFMVAASRHEGMPNFLAHSHHRAMIDWYLASLEPSGSKWLSHGDGGDTGPAIWVMTMWKYFYPDDAKINLVWRNVAASLGEKPYGGRYHIIEPLIYADDPKPELAKQDAISLKLPTTFLDPVRGSLNARNGWSADAAAMQFECRVDSVGASHEHADRGAFTFSALGRVWAKDNFRSIETRHHNSVLIDGKGQGYWPGPGRWLGTSQTPYAISAACDAKDAYGWFWPKQIIAEDPDAFIRFKFPRWESYLKEARTFRQNYAGVPLERDTRPSVVAHWQGFADVAGGPRMWDEDGWPVRLPHNPVQKAFRTVVFVRSPQPYLLVVDDIRKDDSERLYEWLMQTDVNTELASIKDNDLVLCDADHPREMDGKPKLSKGDRQLLVRVLDSADPAQARDYSAKPSFRLETFERKDTLDGNGRSFGIDKRLVIASRSVEPGFKVLLVPTSVGSLAPTVTWAKDRKSVTLTYAGVTDTITFTPAPDGRTLVSLSREGRETLAPVQENPGH
jgi:hypothetical protein